MTCEEFTKEINRYPKLYFSSKLGKFYYLDDGNQIPVDNKDLPQNGIYIMFDKYEPCPTSHAFDSDSSRIVRIGINDRSRNGKDTNTLTKRLLKHFKGNVKNSTFRKKVAIALMNSPLYIPDIDIEKQVSAYIEKHISFVLIDDSKGDLIRIKYEEPLINLVIKCPNCQATKNWLGKYNNHDKLWNVKGISKQYLFTPQDEDILFSNVYNPAFRQQLFNPLVAQSYGIETSELYKDDLSELEEEPYKSIIECYKKYNWNDTPTGSIDNPVFNEDMLRRISCMSGVRMDIVKDTLTLAVRKEIIKITLKGD